MMKCRVLTLLAVSCLLGCSFASAARDGEGSSVAVNYIIRSLGTDIGSVSAKTVGTTTDNDFRAEVSVNVPLPFFGFSLSSTETASIRNGKLVSYRKTITNKAHRREITGERKGDFFNMAVWDEGKVEHRKFSVTDYAITNLEYPEVTLARGEVRKMRVFDLENAEIVDREYRQVEEEQTETNGRRSRVIVTDFTDKNAEGRRWTTITSGLPIVMRQKGKEKTGLFNPSYLVRQATTSAKP